MGDLKRCEEWGAAERWGAVGMSWSTAALGMTGLGREGEVSGGQVLIAVTGCLSGGG